MSEQIQCDSVDDAVSIIKKLIVDENGDPWVDCENTQDSIESILKRTLYIDDSDNVYINLIE